MFVLARYIEMFASIPYVANKILWIVYDPRVFRMPNDKFQRMLNLIRTAGLAYGWKVLGATDFYGRRSQHA